MGIPRDEKIRRYDAVKAELSKNKELRTRVQKHFPEPNKKGMPSPQGHVLKIEIDLNKPISPQLRTLEEFAQGYQMNLHGKLFREVEPLKKKEFKIALEVLKRHVSGQSFQQIGNALWPRDVKGGGPKSKARRMFLKILSEHEYPYPKPVALSRRKKKPTA